MCTKATKSKKRKGQLHKDIIAIKELVVKALANQMAKLNKAQLRVSCPLSHFFLSMPIKLTN